MEVEIFVCSRCGDEIDAGDLDHNGRHAYCGGEPQPNGTIEVEHPTIPADEFCPHGRLVICHQCLAERERTGER